MMKTGTNMVILLIAVSVQLPASTGVQVFFNTQLDYEPPIVNKPCRLYLNLTIGSTGQALTRDQLNTRTFKQNIDVPDQFQLLLQCVCDALCDALCTELFRQVPSERQVADQSLYCCLRIDFRSLPFL